MKFEDLVIRLKIEEDNRNAEKKSRQNRPRRNSKATVMIVARLVIDLLIVMLQERTKTKAKAKAKQTSWKRWKMQMTCVQ